MWHLIYYDRDHLFGFHLLVADTNWRDERWEDIQFITDFIVHSVLAVCVCALRENVYEDVFRFMFVFKL